MKQEELTILAGIPGSGKSHYANQWEKPYEVIVASDDIRRWLWGDVNIQNHTPAVMAIRTATVITLLEQGYDVISDDTNVEQEHLDAFIQSVRSRIKNVYITLVIFHCPVDTAYERIRKDLRNGVVRANVPYLAIANAASHLNTLLDAIKRDEVDADAVVYRQDEQLGNNVNVSKGEAYAGAY